MPQNSKLNPEAPEFVPSSYAAGAYGMDYAVNELSEDNITQEELDELEMAEDWVVAMAVIDELEKEHLIELALRFAPRQKLHEIQNRFGPKPMKLRGHRKPAGVRSRGSG